jgi:hypothetical protein
LADGLRVAIEAAPSVGIANDDSTSLLIALGEEMSGGWLE